MAKSEEKARNKATWIVSVAIMCSRLLGMVREIILAMLFGANKWLDCYFLAFKIPNMLRDLFGEGALSTAFVTTFSQKIKKEGDKSAFELASKMFTLVSIFMSILVIIGVIIAPSLVKLMVDWDDERVEFTILLTRIMFPFIGIISLSALTMGFLNSKNYFGIPALASSFFNLGSIISGVSLGYYFDNNFGKNALIGMAIGVVIGGLCQLLVQFPSLYKTGYRYLIKLNNFACGDKGVKKIIRLMIPALIASGAVQVNVAVNAFFATKCDVGALSWLSYSFRLMQLPLGIFGVAIAMITLPAVSRASTDIITTDFRKILSSGIRKVLVLTLPSTIGLFLLAEPIISLIYQRGQFTKFDTMQAGIALKYYALGLLFYACIKVLQPAFYAINKRWIPMLLTIFSIIVNVFLNILFINYIFKDSPEKHAYLALSTSLVTAVNFCLLYLFMHKQTKKFDTILLFKSLLKLTVPCLCLFFVCYFSKEYLMKGSDFFDYSIIKKIMILIPTIAIAGLVYFIMAYLFRVKEATELSNVFINKLKR